jgi:hypothetical protein
VTYKIIILLIVIFLVGCDTFPGPTVINEFPEHVEVTIQYGDGKEYSHVWPPCQRVQIGATEVGRFGMKAKDVSIDRIIVVRVGEKKDEVALNFDKEAIRGFMEEEKKRDKHTVWVLNESGIHLSESQECEVR